MLALQRSMGNRAVTRMLLRQPKTVRPPHLRPPTTAKRAEALRDEAEGTYQSVKAFSQRATPRLGEVNKRVSEYLKEYGEAYEQFSKTLEEGEREAVKTEKWQETALAIIMGTGIGLAAAALFEAETFLGETLWEVAKEGAKEVVLHSDHGPQPDFAPPPGVTLSDKAAVQWKGLAGVWAGLARLDNRALAFDDYRRTMREAVEGLTTIARGGKAQKTAAEYEAIVAQAERSPSRSKLKVALRRTEDALALFLEAFDSPVLTRTADELEQDLWIRWIASGEAPKDFNDDQYQFFLKKAMAFKSEAVRAELERVGVTYRLDAREFWTSHLWSRGNEVEKTPWWEVPADAYERAKRAERRVEQIGRLGVVVLVPQTRLEGGVGGALSGVVHLRQDAYASARRQMPRPAPADEYIEIAWDRGVDLEPGQIVIVDTTSSTGVQVRPLGSNLPVRHEETNAALKYLGFDPVTFDELGSSQAAPNSLASENLLPLAREAVGWGIMKRTSWTITQLADEGVLISTKEGPMVLVVPIDSFGPITTLLLQQKLAVPQVVVVTPSGMRTGPDLPPLDVKYRERNHAALAIRDSALAARSTTRSSHTGRH